MAEIHIGQRFGKYTVIKQVEKPNYLKNKGTYWLCRCDCGNETVMATATINRNHSLSCGKCRRSDYNLSGDYGVGYTLKGEKFYFDLEDYDKIKDFNWSYFNDGYLRGWDKNNKRIVYMHRLILGLNTTDKKDVDHINHKKYDNRKSNLRIVSKSQNSMNTGLKNNNTSGVTGVRWNKNRNKWESYIMVNKKYIYLGLFEKFENAVKARKDAEEEYFGEYAYKKG